MVIQTAGGDIVSLDFILMEKMLTKQWIWRSRSIESMERKSSEAPPDMDLEDQMHQTVEVEPEQLIITADGKFSSLVVVAQWQFVFPVPEVDCSKIYSRRRLYFGGRFSNFSNRWTWTY